MKKKFIAVIAAVCMCLACLPLLAGCKGGTDYILKTRENGEKYYSVKCSGYTSSLQGEYIIPSEYGEGENRAPVEEIEPDGFSNTGYTKITLPATIKKIGSGAFAYNSLLKEVVYEEGIKLEEISRGAFGYCLELETARLPASIKSIGYMAFYSCNSLATLVLPEGLEKIGGFAFELCTALNTVDLPQTLITVGEGAFSRCSSLKEIVIPHGVRDTVNPVLDENGVQKTDDKGSPVTETVCGIGYGAFHYCTALELAVIEAEVKTVLSGTFGFCTALKEVYLPASLESIEGARYIDGSLYAGHAFHNASALTDVYYAGTAEQWNLLKAKIAEDKVTESKTEYSNEYLLKATIHYGAVYNN